jgi:biopolymer transport protein ExbB
MNVIAPFLALVLSASAVVGQEFTTFSLRPPVLVAQVAAPQAVPNEPAPGGAADQDSFSISSTPAASKARTSTPAAPTTNLWELVRSGGWAMIPLGFLSVVTVMLLLVYLFTLRRSSILTAHYMNTADVLLRKKDYLGLLAISSRHSETVARIVQRTLDFATKNPGANYETIREIAETEGGAQAASLQHRITYLADIAVLAPMIGLLGTVVGIIRSFGVLGSGGNTTQSRDILLASGVSEALIATAGGLVLGILAMGCYALFRNRVHSLISDLEIATVHILGLLALQFGKKQEQRSRVVMEDDF